MSDAGRLMGKVGDNHYLALRDILIEQYMLHEIQHQGVPYNAAERQDVEMAADWASVVPSAERGGDEVEQVGNGSAVSFETGPLAQSSVQPPKAHELVDIYKCLHQGEFGIGHSIYHADQFRVKLERELFSHPPKGNEPLIEIISVNGQVARLNLRPFRYLFADDLGNAVTILAQVCLESAHTVKGDPGRFLETLYAFRELNAEKKLRVGRIVYLFDVQIVNRFLAWVKELIRRLGDIPVFGHSHTYRNLNAPAYRVIDLQVLMHSQLGKSGRIVSNYTTRLDS